jgi:hypothetical protein
MMSGEVIKGEENGGEKEVERGRKWGEDKNPLRT